MNKVPGLNIHSLLPQTDHVLSPVSVPGCMAGFGANKTDQVTALKEFTAHQGSNLQAGARPPSPGRSSGKASRGKDASGLT